MKPAALQAEQTFLNRVEIRLSGESVPPPPAQVSIEARTQLAELPEKGLWRADLRIALHPSEDQPLPPYEIEVDITGIFRVVAPMEPDAARKMAYVNGMSILYSSIRETVLILTGRFPAGPFVLPTLSFVDEYDRLAPLKVAESPAPYGERKK